MTTVEDVSDPIRKLIGFGRMIKFSHTIFAMPFALSMAVIVGRETEISIYQWILIILALVAARTAAMGFNRLVDLKFDQINPRTARRELVTGEVSIVSALILVIISSLAFIAVSWGLGVHCLILSPLVLAILLGYSYSKRFTAFSHLVLGLCLAMAPGGVWYALTGRLSFLPLVMMLAVLFWVASFDMLYSCQDENFDRQNGLHSLPALLGVTPTIQLAFFLHTLTVLLLVLFGFLMNLGNLYFLGILVFALLIANQYRFISAAKIDAIDQAFFTNNGIASVVFFLFTFIDTLLV